MYSMSMIITKSDESTALAFQSDEFTDRHLGRVFHGFEEVCLFGVLGMSNMKMDYGVLLERTWPLHLGENGCLSC